MLSDNVSVTLIREWTKAYKKRPKTTVCLTVVFIALGITGSVVMEHFDQARSTTMVRQSQDSKSQMEQLDATEKNLNSLLAFIHSQREQLEDFQRRIEALKTEKDQLEPLVKIDKNVVDALFLAQERRQSARVWRERWIGFGSGVLASLLASGAWYAIVHLLRGKRQRAEPKGNAQSNAEPPPTADREGVPTDM